MKKDKIDIKSIYNYFPRVVAITVYYIVEPVVSPILYLNFNYLKLNPNVLSSISLLFSIFSVYNFYNHEFIWASIFYFISFAFDCMDGPTARYFKKVSKFGIITEVWTDSFRLIGSTFALAFGLYQIYQKPYFIVLAILWSISFGAGIWTEAKFLETYGKLMKKIPEKHSHYPVLIWTDVEIIGFFLLPLLGFEKLGFFVVTLGYVILTIGQSIYFIKFQE